MSCFRGGVEDGSAGCQTSGRQRQPSPRATRLWVLRLHSSRTPWLDGASAPASGGHATQRRGDCHVMLAGLHGALSFPRMRSHVEGRALLSRVSR